MFCCVATGQFVGFGNFGVALKGSVRVSFLVCWCVFAWVVCSWLCLVSEGCCLVALW